MAINGDSIAGERRAHELLARPGEHLGDALALDVAVVRRRDDRVDPEQQRERAGEGSARSGSLSPRKLVSSSSASWLGK